jgi:hypothetical protein
MLTGAGARSTKNLGVHAAKLRPDFEKGWPFFAQREGRFRRAWTKGRSLFEV